jgi:hypothetical protein
MGDAARLIFALVMAAASTFAIGVLAMDYVGLRLDFPLPLRIVMIVVAMILVGLGLGARTVRATSLGRFTPVLFGLIAVLPAAVWRASQIVWHYPFDPAWPNIWQREFSIVVFGLLVPCVAGIYASRSLARK